MGLVVWGYSLCGVVWCGTGHWDLICVFMSQERYSFKERPWYVQDLEQDMGRSPVLGLLSWLLSVSPSPSPLPPRSLYPLPSIVQTNLAVYSAVYARMLALVVLLFFFWSLSSSYLRAGIGQLVVRWCHFPALVSLTFVKQQSGFDLLWSCWGSGFFSLGVQFSSINL